MKYNSKGELGNFLWCLLLLQEFPEEIKNTSQRNKIKGTLHKFLCRNGIEKVFMSFIVLEIIFLHTFTWFFQKFKQNKPKGKSV